MVLKQVLPQKIVLLERMRANFMSASVSCHPLLILETNLTAKLSVERLAGNLKKTQTFFILPCSKPHILISPVSMCFYRTHKQNNDQLCDSCIARVSQ